MLVNLRSGDDQIIHVGIGIRTEFGNNTYFNKYKQNEQRYDNDPNDQERNCGKYNLPETQNAVENQNPAYDKPDNEEHRTMRAQRHGNAVQYACNPEQGEHTS